jgi:hypothetical protein
MPAWPSAVHPAACVLAVASALAYLTLDLLEDMRV